LRDHPLAIAEHTIDGANIGKPFQHHPRPAGDIHGRIDQIFLRVPPEVNAALNQCKKVFPLSSETPVQGMLEDTVRHVSKSFGIGFGHTYQSDAGKKIVSVLILKCSLVPPAHTNNGFYFLLSVIFDCFKESRPIKNVSLIGMET